MKTQQQETTSLKIAFGCIVLMLFMSVMQFSTLNDCKHRLDYQEDRTLQLLSDSVALSKTLSRWATWHYLLDEGEKNEIKKQIVFEKQLRIK
jgi:hypothetical protein